MTLPKCQQTELSAKGARFEYSSSTCEKIEWHTKDSAGAAPDMQSVITTWASTRKRNIYIDRKSTERLQIDLGREYQDKNRLHVL